MADRVKRVSALTVFTPILPGREGPLQARLETLEVGEGSPVARCGRTHFARWVVIPELVWEGPPQKPDPLSSQYLLFTSSFDGDQRSYLRDLRGTAREDVDAIWSNCVGFPKAGDDEAFADYLLHNHVPSQFFVTAYPHLTLPAVRRVLELRERVTEFACKAQSMEAGELQQAFLAAFPEEPRHWTAGGER